MGHSRGAAQRHRAPGLPLITFELKNSLTKQTVEDAIEQYKRDRDPRETLFEFGRCVVHFAVDDAKVAMCTALKGGKGMAKDSWFLPFDQGWSDGAGNHATTAPLTVKMRESDSPSLRAADRWVGGELMLQQGDRPRPERRASRAPRTTTAPPAPDRAG